jgi:hypothetical protein
VWVTAVWLPSPSVAVTVKSWSPSVEVSIGSPSATGPTQDRIPEPSGSSAQAKSAVTTWSCS